MNILEAAKSGKRFKRKTHGCWFAFDKDRLFNLDDIVADDWEIEVAREITTFQFWSAVSKAQKSGDIETLPYRLAVNLGLE